MSQNNRGGSRTQANRQVARPTANSAKGSVSKGSKRPAKNKVDTKQSQTDAKLDAALRKSVQARLKPFRKQVLKIGVDVSRRLMQSDKLATEIENGLRKTLGLSRGPGLDRANLHLNEWTKIRSELLSVLLDVRDLSQRSAELLSGFHIACIPQMSAANLARVKEFRTTELLRDVKSRTEKVSGRLDRVVQTMNHFERHFSNTNDKALLKQTTAARVSIASLIQPAKPLSSEETSLLDNSSVPGIMGSFSVLLPKNSIILLHEFVEGQRGSIKSGSAQGGTHNMSQCSTFLCLLGVVSMILADILTTEAWITRNGAASSLRSQQWEYTVKELYSILGDALNSCTKSLVVTRPGSKKGGSALSRLFSIFKR